MDYKEQLIEAIKLQLGQLIRQLPELDEAELDALFTASIDFVNAWQPEEPEEPEEDN